MVLSRHRRASDPAHKHPRQGSALATLALAAAALLAGGAAAQAQTAQPAIGASAVLAPALSDLRSALGGLHINHWRAPDPVRNEAQSNADSVTRDLSDTLPGLLQTSDNSPQSVSAAFGVYRNIEALYDVLLRVTNTADLAAPDKEAHDLARALTSLEAGRKSLAENIMTASRTQETALTQLRAASAAAASAPATAQPAPSRVVTDGPSSATPARKPRPKAKPAPAPAPQ